MLADLQQLPAFPSGAPRVRLVNAFSRPFENAVATARTCYSGKGIITEAEVSGDREPDPVRQADRRNRRDDLAKSIYHAGHHTTLQHAHFQFTLENVSRHFLWAFLHAHPYYNSEQVSQRYVEVKPGNYVVPPLQGTALEVYESTARALLEDYHHLRECLEEPVRAEYLRIFPARKRSPVVDREVKKKAQEIARYCLPIATTAFLYHTISGITLLRYWRIANQLEASLETRWVLSLMVQSLLEVDPLFKVILEEPVPLDQTPEYQHFVSVANHQPTAFRREFDADLGGRVSRLVDWKQHNEEILAQSVREVLGLTRATMDDDTAIRAALDPGTNSWLGETMNVSTLSKLSRCLFHPGYTFRKRLSHTADSQDQRHRMVPASRPILSAQADAEPDYILPHLVESEPKALALYRASMQRAWDSYNRLQTLGVDADTAGYLLPNAVAVRYTESADLLNLHHKLRSRLCYLAQEEIWRASVDEALQIRSVNPRIGMYLLPPCGVRQLAKASPICPEGDRYCGVPVWRLQVEDYRRMI
jgi:thymidylate synthase ThyX